MNVLAAASRSMAGTSGRRGMSLGVRPPSRLRQRPSAAEGEAAAIQIEYLRQLLRTDMTELATLREDEGASGHAGVWHRNDERALGTVQLTDLLRTDSTSHPTDGYNMPVSNDYDNDI